METQRNSNDLGVDMVLQGTPCFYLLLLLLLLYDWFTALRLGGHDHPTYSSNLTPSDFRHFGPVKKHLAHKQFAKDTSMKPAVNFCLQELDTNFFPKRNQTWVQQ
jgi:hypothetical protein